MRVMGSFVVQPAAIWSILHKFQQNGNKIHIFLIDFIVFVENLVGSVLYLRAFCVILKFNSCCMFWSYFQVGDKLPTVDLFEDSPANKLSSTELCSGKKVVIFAVPGAFTPGCSKVNNNRIYTIKFIIEFFFYLSSFNYFSAYLIKYSLLIYNFLTHKS